MFGFAEMLKNECHLLEPLEYLDFLALQKQASLVITDSGGIQEETTYLEIPCLTIRSDTERPVTITHRTNQLVACKRKTIVETTKQILSNAPSGSKPPPALWDGKAAERIARILGRSEN